MLARRLDTYQSASTNRILDHSKKAIPVMSFPTDFQPQSGLSMRLKVDFLSSVKKIPVGEAIKLKFKLTDSITDLPRDGLDISTFTFLVPGVWQKRNCAQCIGEGVYEVDVSVPRAGVYYVFLGSPSNEIGYDKLPHLVFEGTGP